MWDASQRIPHNWGYFSSWNEWVKYHTIDFNLILELKWNYIYFTTPFEEDSHYLQCEPKGTKNADITPTGGGLLQVIIKNCISNNNQFNHIGAFCYV